MQFAIIAYSFAIVGGTLKTGTFRMYGRAHGCEGMAGCILGKIPNEIDLGEPERGANGRQPFPSECIPGSGAAASRGSRLMLRQSISFYYIRMTGRGEVQQHGVAGGDGNEKVRSRC